MEGCPAALRLCALFSFSLVMGGVFAGGLAVLFFFPLVFSIGVVVQFEEREKSPLTILSSSLPCPW